MAKKKNKQILRPWCWYCEREFEDEKVLMQHQKAKHFKCGMCPRRLNTAGGLAVHIQQVHKLEPENLPRIENAISGRDGYEVEIFGMEGIPAPDIADYKRHKEIELGLVAGSISQPQAKRPKIDNRPMSEDELKAQLEAHKALMGLNNPEPSANSTSDANGGGNGGAVYGAPAQTYVAPPIAMPPTTAILPPPPFPPGGSPPPGMPPFSPPFPTGMPPVPGFPAPPGFPDATGISPFPLPPSGARPPFPPFLPPGTTPPPGFPGFSPPGVAVPPGSGSVPGASPPPPPTFVPASNTNINTNQHLPIPTSAPSTLTGTLLPAPPAVQGDGIVQSVPVISSLPPVQPKGHAQGQSQPPQLTLPNPALKQTLPEVKKPTDLKWADPNYSPEEYRSIHPKYYQTQINTIPAMAAGLSQDEPRGKKRARAEDFL